MLCILCAITHYMHATNINDDQNVQYFQIPYIMYTFMQFYNKYFQCKYLVKTCNFLDKSILEKYDTNVTNSVA